MPNFSLFTSIELKEIIKTRPFKAQIDDCRKNKQKGKILMKGRGKNEEKNQEEYDPNGSPTQQC